MSLRPGGVSVIAILFLLSAIGAIIGGIFLLVAPEAVKTFYDTNVGPLLASLPIVGDRLVDVGYDTIFMVGIAAIPIGIVDFIAGLGLFKLKKYGYWLAILISLPLIVAIIGIVFIWYLRKDEVKAAFDIM
ncbi:MAG: hypothetical protein ACTSRS_08245 [Candidatus Helarchaeota archaeon]